MHTRDYSEHTSQVIDDEVELILRAQEQRALEVLARHRGGLDAVARAPARRGDHRRRDGRTAGRHRLRPPGPRTGRQVGAPDLRRRPARPDRHGRRSTVPPMDGRLGPGAPPTPARRPQRSPAPNREPRRSATQPTTRTVPRRPPERRSLPQPPRGRGHRRRPTAAGQPPPGRPPSAASALADRPVRRGSLAEADGPAAYLPLGPASRADGRARRARGGNGNPVPATTPGAPDGPLSASTTPAATTYREGPGRHRLRPEHHRRAGATVTLVHRLPPRTVTTTRGCRSPGSATARLARWRRPRPGHRAPRDRAPANR